MNTSINSNHISVIMPVYNQAHFIKCAIKSLLNQTYNSWELIIIDDGSKDNLFEIIEPFLSHEHIIYYRNDKNKGLGYSLNKGIELSSHPFIAYLPADDLYFSNHLESLIEVQRSTQSDIVYSGIAYNKNNIGGEDSVQTTKGRIESHTLQLVQVLHKKTNDKWLERSELVTDDLDRMFWNNFQKNNNKITGTQKVTCEWISHLYQRHKIIIDAGGGINMYRSYYSVNEPIRFQSSIGNYIDEISHYAHVKKIKKKKKSKPLKILLVGELAYNPERILAFEEHGHELYGLWINNPYNFNTIGPLPFGNVIDIPFDKWREKIEEIKPDIIYALLNFKAIDLAYLVLSSNPGIPFIWHFKEGPFYCRTFGLWDKLMKLYTKADGVIFTNDLTYEWFKLFLPDKIPPMMILDGDLPKKEWFNKEKQPLLSNKNGEIHTVIAGRLLGINTGHIETMTDQGIHLHIYGDVFHNQSRALIDEAIALAPDYVHLHPNCPQEDWVSEFSKYDAGWLHYFESSNYGDLMRVNWRDINSPARMSTYAMAGLPMLMHNNKDHLVYHQKFLESYNMAIPINSFSDLKEIFNDKDKINQIRNDVWNNREIFSFDYYVDDLISFFEQAITSYNNKFK